MNNKRMKGIKLILAACLAPIVFQGATADDLTDAARAATRRGATTSAVSNRQRSKPNVTQNAGNNISRTTNLAAPATQSVRERTETTNSRGNNVVTRTTNRNNSTGTTTSRTTQNVQSRTAKPVTATSTISRATATQRTGTPPARTSVSRAATSAPQRTTATSARTGVSRGANISRAATGGITREDILGKNYSKCRTVYYDCMDEFCANKDAQLRRCACSTRANEFDKAKKQLSNVEEKLLDFNQRLLTVNMDKEDAAALFTATEGELAFNQKDTSTSKKMLDEIAKKLNTSFDSSNFDTNLRSLSWSLDADSAFDTVDSLMGANVTSKSGTELYSAALPVCREMAQEVCTPDELEIAQSGYQMQIEQDCNTVAKSYETQTDQAREKVREGGALLDMSRLDIYQKRNSDDILTCKKKMLTMLSDTSVCGTDLGKCLDTSGRYIDPSTGEAFLTTNLADLATLITRPTTGQTWTTAPGNESFVAFLNSKKKFLEPAMENCQDIADYVWNEFVEDALAQIKLAQDSKLETMRQSCTTLTAQCLADTAESLADFDARALSTFGVAADQTVNAICADIRNACTALMEATGGGDTEWIGGMTEIATDTTYDTIIQTCREVGRSCIIQACKSIGGNFGLCENIQTSVNRKSIINRTSCWADVKKCVASAGENSINNIFQQLSDRGELDTDSNAFYTKLYGKGFKITNDDAQCAMDPIYSNDIFGQPKENKYNCIYDICMSDCGCKNVADEYSCEDKDTQKCKVCRLSEKIWGNCEVNANVLLEASGSHNRIRIIENDQTATLLSWFALNTGTTKVDDSCRDTSCGIGYILMETAKGRNECIDQQNITKGDKVLCESDRINTGTENENCCGYFVSENNYVPGNLDALGNCCLDTVQSITKLNNTEDNLHYIGAETLNLNPLNLCVKTKDDTNATLVATFDNYYLVCMGTVSAADTENPNYPTGQTLKCDGQYVLIDTETKQYISPNYDNTNINIFDKLPNPANYLNEENSAIKCELQFNKNTKSYSYNCGSNKPNNWKIKYK